MPDFKSEKERQTWIVRNAKLFTVVRLRNRRYERHKAKTLGEAETLARTLIDKHPDSRWMIYAVADGAGVEIDTYVKTMSP